MNPSPQPVVARLRELLESYSHVANCPSFERMYRRDLLDSALRNDAPALLDELERLRKENDEGMREAVRLSTIICRAECRDEFPDWTPLETIAGVLSQIDNMYAGIRSQRDEALAERDCLGDDSPTLTEMNCVFGAAQTTGDALWKCPDCQQIGHAPGEPCFLNRDTTNEKGGEPCASTTRNAPATQSNPEQLIQGVQLTDASNAPAPVQSQSQGQELDLGRLIKSLPPDVNKKLSLHDLKRIADNYNAQ